MIMVLSMLNPSQEEEADGKVLDFMNLYALNPEHFKTIMQIIRSHA